MQEIEGVARSLMRDGEGSLLELVKRSGLRVEYASNLPGDGALCRVHDEWRIYVKRGLPAARRLFAIAHEFAEWALRSEHLDDPEACANYLAACLITPREQFSRAIAAGLSLAELAEEFTTTETHAALRTAEVRGIARVVVSPALVRVRGPESWVWPEEWTLRKMAKTGAILDGNPRRRMFDVA